MTKEKLFKKWFSYKNKFKDNYNCDKDLTYKDDNGHPLDIKIIYSGRKRGKSFDISAKILADCWYNKKELAYIRRYDRQLTGNQIEQYFADKKDFIIDMTDGQANCVRYYRGLLYFCDKYLEDGKTVYKNIKTCGYGFSMNLAEQYKSLQYPDLYYMIFEEFLTNKQYVKNEPNELLNLISTLRRFKEDFHVFMISNTISRINPYSQDWSLTRMSRQKAGEEHFYKLYTGEINENGEEEYFLISCEYLRDKIDLIEKKDKEKDSKKKYIQFESNRWDILNTFKTLSEKDIEKYGNFITDVIPFGIEYGDYKFLCRWCEVPENIENLLNINDDTIKPLDLLPFLFITRKTGKFYNTRYFTNNNSYDPMSNKGLAITLSIDKIFFKFCENGQIIFADNLTGNEFYQCYENLKNIKK
jgi:hypothetical protein